MSYMAAIPAAVILLATVVAAVTDVWRFKVHNVLTFPLLLLGIVFHSVTAGVNGLVLSLTGAALGFTALIVLYAIGAMGAGDVKFVTAIGAWVGTEQILPAILIGCIAAGVYAVVLLALHGGAGHAWINLQLAMYRVKAIGRHLVRNDESETCQEIAKDLDVRRKRLIPFSAMVGIGVVATLVWKTWCSSVGLTH